MKKIILFIVVISLFVWCSVVIGQVLMNYWQQHQEDQASKMVVTFLDIGQGDATYIAFPDGSDMLVDCAIDARVLEALGRNMAFFDRRIDYLVITHPDKDHYGGCIDVMQRFDIGQIWYNGLEKDTDFHQSFLEQRAKEPARHVLIDRRTVMQEGDVSIDVLFPNFSVTTTVESFPQGSNNSSIVMKLSYGEMDVLLMGDAEEETENFLLSYYQDELNVEVLKAGHHGSDSSSKQPFLETITPQHVVVSAGKDNRYGHPHEEVIDRIQNIGATLWRTDEMGDVRVIVRTSSLFFEAM